MLGADVIHGSKTGDRPDLVLAALRDDATARMQHGRFVVRDTGAENRRGIIEMPRSPQLLAGRLFHCVDHAGIENHVAVVQPGDEASDDPENLANWRLSCEIEIL